jgi:hypothetical protein
LITFYRVTSGRLLSGGGTVKYSRLCFSLSFVFFIMMAIPALASQCVECHTDSERLKEIAKTLPRPEASAETAGKG